MTAFNWRKGRADLNIFKPLLVYVPPEERQAMDFELYAISCKVKERIKASNSLLLDLTLAGRCTTGFLF